MGNTAVQCPIQPAVVKHPKNKSCRKRITAANTVQYLQIRHPQSAMHFFAPVRKCSPVVAVRCTRPSYGRDHNSQTGCGLLHPLRHRGKALRCMHRRLQRTLYRLQGNISFMTKQHINIRKQVAIHMRRPLSATARLPKRRPIVAVEGNNRSIFACCLHRLAD
jgi:hypothetical protein